MAERWQQIYGFLFQDDLADADLEVWLARLSTRIADVEQALAQARHRRAMLVAHMHDTFGRSFTDIAGGESGLSPQRLGQMAKAGRPHIKPLSAGR